jgi:hypothetical protein
MNAADQRRADLIERESCKPGLRGKINAKCIECIFDAEGGGGSWRQQVQDCTAPACPLYQVRPTSSSESVEVAA